MELGWRLFTKLVLVGSGVGGMGWAPQSAFSWSRQHFYHSNDEWAVALRQQERVFRGAFFALTLHDLVFDVVKL